MDDCLQCSQLCCFWLWWLCSKSPCMWEWGFNLTVIRLLCFPKILLSRFDSCFLHVFLFRLLFQRYDFKKALSTLHFNSKLLCFIRHSPAIKFTKAHFFFRFAHQITFAEERLAQAKDAMMKGEDYYDIYDPRNSINKRRRNEADHKKQRPHR